MTADPRALTVEQIDNIVLHYFGREGDQSADGMDISTVRKLCDMARATAERSAAPAAEGVQEPQYLRLRNGVAFDKEGNEEASYGYYVRRKDYDALRSRLDGGKR